MSQSLEKRNGPGRHVLVGEKFHATDANYSLANHAPYFAASRTSATVNSG